MADKRKFAAYTKVPVATSQGEVEKLVTRYGATHFGVMREPSGHMVGFRINNLSVRFVIPRPDVKATDRHGYKLSASALHTNVERETRRLWRALVLSIKAKLEMIESGLACFEEEFLAHVVTGSGRTIGEEVIPQLEDIQSGKMLPLLPAPKE